ncbi:hypothetical protein [Nesterenkonia alkaliphila]|uniref:Pyridoxamine 5'-phosphate oxidase family protein n=1 Tax=Nesterenkonia alkaliphila TaxID=1463631 RepID=A0A7K1UL32_9MICC|nr:hypothetical protein [Nesterenkonia alkaliphila]MVT27183.1 hypothetical protein [Nesterenkonia alkaliphila]GFZ97093.1 hypothetical protein GCM10011359_28110 [Nesterenkonia alkaliphila]
MTTRSNDHAVADRAAKIIRGAGYLSLATATPEEGPWAAQLQYAWFTNPFRLVVGSAVASRHFRDIATTGLAAATISTLPGTPHGLDGLQLRGPCWPLTGPELEATAPPFYAQMFPDAADAQAHALPLEELDGPGPQRLLACQPSEVWILDLDRWERDGVSARRALNIASIEDALGEVSADV